MQTNGLPDNGTQLKCEFTKREEIFDRNIETTYEIDLIQGTVVSAGFYFVGPLGLGRKSSFVNTSNFNKLAEILENMEQKQKLLRDLSEGADRHLIKASLDDVDLKFASHSEGETLIMNLGGMVVEGTLESAISGLREFKEKETTFANKVGEK